MDPRKFTNLTLNQFKSWLEGVEEMQGDDWCPSPDQWKKIRAKISLLMDREDDDLESVVRRVIATAGNIQPNFNNGPPAPRQYDAGPGPVVVPAGSSGLDVDALGIPVGGAAVTPRFQPIPEGSPTVPAKTPNIDTSHGDYKSPFA